LAAVSKFAIDSHTGIHYLSGRLTVSMSLIKLVSCFLAGAMLFTACSSKKTPVLSGEEPVAVSDFIDFFEPLSLPYQAGDTLFNRKDKDSLLISNKIFTQFVKDTVLTRTLVRGSNPSFMPWVKQLFQKLKPTCW